MKRISVFIIVLLLFLFPNSASALVIEAPGSINIPLSGYQLSTNIPKLPSVPGSNIQIARLVNIAFSISPIKCDNIDPSKIIDINFDEVGDISISGNSITGKNGCQIILMDPPVLDIDSINSVPSTGYTDSAEIKKKSVYLAKFPSGTYAKFMINQTSPKINIVYNFGKPTASVLTASGSPGKVILRWDPLPEAEIGYKIYRYELLDNNKYSYIPLNDFNITETNFIDETAKSKYYTYVVYAIRSDGKHIAQTTVAPLTVQALLYCYYFKPNSATARIGHNNVTLDGPAVIKAGQLMIPATALADAGVTVSYNSTNKELILERKVNNKTLLINMTINESDYTLNDMELITNVVPCIIGDDVYIPIRIAEGLGLYVYFDSPKNEAIIAWYE